MFPKQVPINQETIERLTKLYKEAYAQIVGEIDGATSFGVANRKAILQQIQEILTQFNSDVTGLINTTISGSYESGAMQAVKQLETVGGELTVSTGFNRIHKEAIAALVDDTARAFGESIQGVNRSAQALLSKGVKEQITQQLAVGKIGGSAMRQIKNSVVGTLKSEGLDSLVDKAGRGWTLDRYAEMLIRTKAVEARNRGMVNRIAENDYDLVQVSAHGASDVCGDWEGKILSVTGQTDGYPTVDEAEGDGLFHPNCRHAINVLVPELAAVTNAYNPNIDTLTGEEFIDEVDEDFKDLARPPKQQIGTKTPAN